MPVPRSYSVYFGGELFSAKHLLGNAALAEAIHTLSEGRYVSVLPQNLEPPEVTAKAIRDLDLRTSLNCDLGLFHYDGPELDSGTVVEYMVAKFADLPNVLLRTDFRGGGDQGEHSSHAWNLMSSFYPRTHVVQLNSLTLYQECLHEGRTADSAAEVLEAGLSAKAAQLMTKRIAARVIEALDAVLQLPPVLPEHLRASVYHWLALMPGLDRSAEENSSAMMELCGRKIALRLL